MEPLKIGTRREVCWDEALIALAEGVSVRMHRPEFKNVALVLDAPWEGSTSSYFSLIREDGFFRLYYRGMDSGPEGSDLLSELPHIPVTCYAESTDGKVFHRVNTGICPFDGSTDNNIILDVIKDNISFFKDTNPACPPEERYKGLAQYKGQALHLFTSADGVHFRHARMVADDAAYDSLNVGFWDGERERYFLFYRGLHGAIAETSKWTAEMSDMAHNDGIVRDVRVRTSEDFVNWDSPQRIRFDPAREDLELYTNNVIPYYRAKHMMIGMPTRYVDRYEDAVNFEYLPERESRAAMIRRFGRTGTAMTDCVLMTSRNGYTFRRTDEVFLSPGPEDGKSWYYGDCFLCYGMAETVSDRPGFPNEISLYVGEEERVRSVKLSRYTIRLDGFFSWNCGFAPGRVVTKPIVFDGSRLSINFATSALGYVRIRLLDPDGNALEGFDSGRLFGDSVDRPVDFEKDLASLAGKPVCLEITMSDADLYSFVFENAEN